MNKMKKLRAFLTTFLIEARVHEYAEASMRGDFAAMLQISCGEEIQMFKNLFEGIREELKKVLDKRRGESNKDSATV